MELVEPAPIVMQKATSVVAFFVPVATFMNRNVC